MKEMVEDIRTVSPDAMGTLIDLKRSLQEIYREILRDLGHDPQKIRRTFFEQSIDSPTSPSL